MSFVWLFFSHCLGLLVLDAVCPWRKPPLEIHTDDGLRIVGEKKWHVGPSKVRYVYGNRTKIITLGRFKIQLIRKL